MNDNPRLQQLTDAEVARLNSESRPKQLARCAGYWVRRTAIRATRLVAGLVLAAVAIWCGSFVVEVLRIPFATLTLGDLVQLVTAAIGALVAGLSALALAFGEAPPRPQLREVAEAAAQQRLELAAEQEKVAHWYRRSRLVGLLFDPTLVKRHRWLPWVSVIGAYAFLGLGVALVSQCSR